MRAGTLAAIMLCAMAAVPVALPQSTQAAERAAHPTWRLSGATALRPARIWDDGQRTYIVWPLEAELPAVFSLGPDGGEMLAEGAMRDGQYVLDRVHTLLIFRIDRSVAKATRRAR